MSDSLKERLAKEANNADTLSESYEGQRQEGWFKAFAATFREALARIEELEAINLAQSLQVSEKIEQFQATIAKLEARIEELERHSGSHRRRSSTRS